MEHIFSTFGLWLVIGAFAVMLFAGFTKGAVGFALPMITISGVGSLMSAEVAIAAIILPSLVTNVMQAARNGLAAAWGSLKKYWRLNMVLLVTIAAFAQLVVLLPDRVLFVILGVMVSVFGILQLTGFRLRFPKRLTHTVEWLVGLVAGFFGGLAGVWGPPILLYLLARETPKVEQVRVQGISFLVGSVVLTAAHLQSGLLNSQTIGFSAWMILPAVMGMLLGQAVQDRLPQERFRRATLFVLVLAGLNLLRRGLLA